ncbi:unnamed protein product [Meganyctiphanes norvegica]|uniref:Uncharacterized protein n=1 Tax=Meganyctiphanes norvegica TaxID=48144 RepID=A0AAV2S6S5_MEGNR
MNYWLSRHDRRCGNTLPALNYLTNLILIPRLDSLLIHETYTMSPQNHQQPKMWSIINLHIVFMAHVMDYYERLKNIYPSLSRKLYTQKFCCTENYTTNKLSAQITSFFFKC